MRTLPPYMSNNIIISKPLRNEVFLFFLLSLRFKVSTIDQCWASIFVFNNHWFWVKTINFNFFLLFIFLKNLFAFFLIMLMLLIIYRCWVDIWFCKLTINVDFLTIINHIIISWNFLEKTWNLTTFNSCSLELKKPLILSFWKTQRIDKLLLN